jgi:hypothetical protein
MIKKNSFGSKNVTSLQAALETEAHLAEGQFSLQEQILNKVSNSKTSTFQRRRTELVGMQVSAGDKRRKT